MGRNYFLFKSGTLKRKENTILIESEDGKRSIPVEDVDSIYIFGKVVFNTEFIDFLAQKKIPLHFFNYYEYYSGSFYPREYLDSGFLLVRQVEHYLDPEKRMDIAKEIVQSASDNILKNLKYYHKRIEEIGDYIKRIEKELSGLDGCGTTRELMSVEGRVRDIYYSSFNEFLKLEEPFIKRERRPPTNPINALISFGNSLLYATILSEIYRSQLNPTISYLHEPGTRRFSLSLDFSEIFKPIIVDRVIFKLINNRMLDEEDFDRELNYCYLTDSGRKKFVREYDEKLSQTIEHRRLKRHVSYKRLIRLECYKLIKHLLGDERYKGFRIWW